MNGIEPAAGIAIIGWGSLLWDLDTLAPHVRGDWQIDRGPPLPLEFVRISAKRKRALTVVIDFEHGLLCPTSHIASRRDDVAAAVADLARRERAPIESIGFFDRVAGSARSRHEPILEWMDRWLAESGIEAAVWTDLTRNFEELTAVDYSIGAAVDYLRSLDGESRIEARRYIENAPAAVATPLRRVLAGQSWWQEIEYDAGIGMQEQRGR